MNHGTETTRSTATAYHEAGHAVYATAVGYQVVKVNVVPVEQGRQTGACFFLPDRRPALQAIAMLFAGGVAQLLHGSAGGAAVDPRASMGSDIADVADMIRRHCPMLPNPHASEMMHDAMSHAADVLREHWPAVEHLAGELLTRKTIDGTDVRRIVDSFRTPLLEGSNR